MASFSASASFSGSASISSLRKKGYVNARGQVTAKGHAKAKAHQKVEKRTDALWDVLQIALKACSGKPGFQAVLQKYNTILPKVAPALPKHVKIKLVLPPKGSPKSKGARIVLGAKVVRALILRARAGHKSSQKIMLKLALGAKAGDPKAVASFATAMAVVNGLARGSVPTATPEEKEEIRQECDEDSSEDSDFEDEEYEEEDDFEDEDEDEDECCPC